MCFTPGLAMAPMGGRGRRRHQSFKDTHMHITITTIITIVTIITVTTIMIAIAIVIGIVITIITNHNHHHHHHTTISSYHHYNQICAADPTLRDWRRPAKARGGEATCQ